MAADQLVGHGIGHVGHVEASRLGGDLRVKHALKQHVAQFAGSALKSPRSIASSAS